MSSKFKIKTNLPTVSIKGKSYVEVKNRIKYLSEFEEDNYSISTDAQYYPDKGMWVVKATLTLGNQTYTGYGQEIEGSSNINKTSALENCETSAVGRACAFAGIGIVDGIASADEVRQAISKQATETNPATSAQLSYIESLLMDANITEQQEQRISGKLRTGMDADSAEKTIAYLQKNQLPKNPSSGRALTATQTSAAVMDAVNDPRK